MSQLWQSSLTAEEQTRTFEKDETLPKLPVPTLHHSIQRYLESAKPFAKDEEEYNKTQNIAHDFINGEGAMLHAKLLEYAQNSRNWIEKWWEDYAYLCLREPLIPYYSMSGPHERLPGYQYSPGQQTEMASIYCYQLVQLWQLLRKEKFKLAMTADKQPLSMDQYRRLFNCSIIPGITKDTIITQFKTEREGVCSSQVVVLCKGHMFLVDSFSPDGLPLTPCDWKHQLAVIQERSAFYKGTNIPHLSCDNRTTWAKNKQHLINLDPTNAENFKLIDAAMFVVSLDDALPATESAVSQLLLCGDYSCRWPDIALNVVFFRNGLSGGLCAHSPFDGIVSGSAMNFTYTALKENLNQYSNKTIKDSLHEPQELKFVLDSYIQSEIGRSIINQQKEKTKFIICLKEFKLFGKKRIQNVKVHPDSFIQMALQLAYYSLHSRFAPCYETATTRTFYHGRTETVRSCTEECVLWVTSMVNPNTKDSTKAKLLLRAIQKHNQLMSEARNGLGCDRHLLGLYCIAKENNLPVPQLFQDPLFDKSGGGGNFILSTSLLGYSPIGGGVSPMCLHGYGVFYSILPERLLFTISVRRDSYETSSCQLFQAITSALQDMADLLEGHTVAKL